MNIFYLSHDVEECARWHVNRHVVKMILEYSQLLSTAHRVLDGKQTIEKEYVIGTNSEGWRNFKRLRLPDLVRDATLYKAAHINHPSCIWTRFSIGNYEWLLSLLKELHSEYTFRYGKIHKSSALLNVLVEIPDNISKAKFSLPPQCMPDKYKHEDTIAAYRHYYAEGKAHLAVWKKRLPPSWYPLQENLQTIQTVI